MAKAFAGKNGIILPPFVEEHNQHTVEIMKQMEEE